MANILLGVTGSVAAIRTPEIFSVLTAAGHQVKVVATHAALYFFDPGVLGSLINPGAARNPEIVVLDEDEWPGFSEGRRYRREDPVLHIELRRWAELLLVAPLDANTLAKLANGLADNCLTCVWRAWELKRPVVVAPAMNTLMWDHPITRRHLRQLALDAGAGKIPEDLDMDELLKQINQTCPRLQVVVPQSKRLACGDVGVGAMADLGDIISAVKQMLANL